MLAISLLHSLYAMWWIWIVFCMISVVHMCHMQYLARIVVFNIHIARTQFCQGPAGCNQVLLSLRRRIFAALCRWWCVKRWPCSSKAKCWVTHLNKPMTRCAFSWSSTAILQRLPSGAHAKQHGYHHPAPVGAHFCLKFKVKCLLPSGAWEEGRFLLYTIE